MELTDIAGKQRESASATSSPAYGQWVFSDSPQEIGRRIAACRRAHRYTRAATI
ncbi:hypothetical protein [Streptomyces sp. MW-W600-10]|uniref:hypothetical protein n=1 Tax=Streptomyces sp. MW-W600-10 TaxID=2829819 RepID=UPI001C45793D|nr:hypothetical protein [Streptomyces sp. MW-W600-10]MBV7245092.1 hypothetical protein [Streptomyces sp. MW-W600-10]